MSTESQRYKRDIYMFVTWQHWSTEGTYLPLKKKNPANSLFALNVTNTKQEGRKE